MHGASRRKSVASCWISVSMTDNRLRQLHAAGQSVWLDYIDRTILQNGDLQRLIDNDAVMGMTSNPSIFEKALSEGGAYDEQIQRVADGRTPMELFELIETDDVRTACDLFAPTFRATGGADGFVSIEVSPGVANDAAATVIEAHRLWETVARPNLMVKVPGTTEGASAVRELIADGVNVNITLLFAVAAHASVIDAYMEGLETRLAKGMPVSGLSSVASFFVSRVDTEVDKRLDRAAAAAPDQASWLNGLRGRAAVANARLAYRLFQKRFTSRRWEALSRHGAQVQRPLWASTSTKNPAYRDVLYVEELIGPHTVNTIPPATIDAFRDHGVVERTVDAHYADADACMADLERAGIDFADVTAGLLRDGLASFQKSFDRLLAGLEHKTAALVR
ncbi:MAG: Transaldolase [Gemmatimonadaceae bacterium]|nr:Transaldolase [Gemmatimonadaceae bacterium]